MAEEPGELRNEIAEHRAAIGSTVDQIENRVSPSRVIARRRDQVRRRLTDVVDSVLGNDEPEYRRYRSRRDHWEPVSSDRAHDGFDDDFGDDTSLTDRIRGAGEALPDTDEATRRMRRKTRGNPAAVGMIGFGVGLLLGSVLPETERERHLARQAQSDLNRTAADAARTGQRIAEDVAEPARDAATDLKESAKDAGRELKDEAADAARSVKDQATT